MSVSDLLIGIQFLNQSVTVNIIRNLRWKICLLQHGNHSCFILCCTVAKMFCHLHLCNQTDRNGFSMQQLIITDCLDGSANRMSKVQNLTQTAFPLVFHNDLIFDLAVLLCDMSAYLILYCKHIFDML